jgi:hypothetical protein
MPTLAPSPLLRFALRLDAALSLAAAIATLAVLDGVSAALGVGASHLSGVAAFMVGWAGLTGWMAGQAGLTRWLVWLAILGNLGWAAASLLLPLLGVFSPNALGWGLLIAQALAVLVFAELQWFGLRRSLGSAASAPAASVR